MESLQGVGSSEVGRRPQQLSGWRWGALLMALGDASKATSREASPRGNDAKERPRLASSRVRRSYAPEPTARAPTQVQAGRALEQREFRRESFPRPLLQRVLMHTPGPAKVLLDGEIKDAPKDFLGPPPQRRPPPSPRDNTQAPGSASHACNSLFQDITRRTASLVVMGGMAGSVPWEAELPAATRISNRHGLPSNDPWVEGGALQGRPMTPALLRAAQAAVAGLWGRATQDTPPRPRSRSSGSLFAPLDRKLAVPYQSNLSLRDAYLAPKSTLPGMQGKDHAELKSAPQGGERHQASTRPRRVVSAWVGSGWGTVDPPPPPSPPTGRPVSRRTRSDPQRT